MKLNFSKNKTHATWGQRAIVVAAILVMVGTGLHSTSAQLGSRKRITSLQSGQTASGTRVSVFSDSSLSDYEAFRRGDRFYIKVPLASFEGPQPSLRGEGFEDIQVQRVGDSIVVSFRLQPGTNARVDQRSNRLDVYFTSQNFVAQTSAPGTQPTRTNTSSVEGIVTFDTRSQQARNSNAAGPMPPDTPSANRPRVATQQPVAYRHASEPTERSQSQSSLDREPSTRINLRNTGNTAAAKSESSGKPEVAPASSNANATALPVPTTTPTYQASTSATPYSPYSSKPVVTSSTSTSTGWAKRLDQAKQWVSMNRTVAAIGGGALLGLLLLAGALLYRQKRKPTQAKHNKVPGVQPKYSPASELGDFQDGFGDEDYETVFDDNAAKTGELKPNVHVPLGNESSVASEGLYWADMFDESDEMDSPDPQTASYAPATPTIPVHAMKHDEYEREVIEL